MLQVKHIRESRFGVNLRDGNFFHEDGTRMTPDEQREFLNTNLAIGYQGDNISLVTWANKHSKGLPLRNLPGETVEEKRELLWQAVKENKLERWLVKLADQVKQGDEVTIYYLSSYDKPVAELLQRFLLWYIKH